MSCIRGSVTTGRCIKVTSSAVSYCGTSSVSQDGRPLYISGSRPLSNLCHILLHCILNPKTAQADIDDKLFQNTKQDLRCVTRFVTVGSTPPRGIWRRQKFTSCITTSTDHKTLIIITYIAQTDKENEIYFVISSRKMYLPLYWSLINFI